MWREIMANIQHSRRDLFLCVPKSRLQPILTSLSALLLLKSTKGVQKSVGETFKIEKSFR